MRIKILIARNEDALVDEQHHEVEDDLNDSDAENQAPINHIDDYVKDYMKLFAIASGKVTHGPPSGGYTGHTFCITFCILS